MFFKTCFNPRTRVGCDTRYCRRITRIEKVSIHAPAWGATEDNKAHLSNSKCFNPRTRVGCDMRLRVFSFWEVMFQSTHPRGVRRASLPPDNRLVPSFNPRTRVGCDHCPRPAAWDAGRFNPRTRVGCDEGLAHWRDATRGVSIHAPAWGATDIPAPSGRGICMVSIHAPAWGATAGPRPAACRRPCFNPRTRVGCDGRYRCPECGNLWFQSTHPRGVRLRGRD